MKAIVVFESMYGNTHAIAEAVANGIELAGAAEVTVVPVSQADDETIRPTCLSWAVPLMPTA
jgi:flavodoxin